MNTAQWTILGIVGIIVLIEVYAAHGNSVNSTLNNFVKTMFQGISVPTGTGETIGPSKTVIGA